jgi:uncharacterized membrane protein YkvI
MAKTATVTRVAKAADARPAAKPPRPRVRKAYFAAVCAFLVAILVQVFLAGRAIFGAGTFELHEMFGYTAVHGLGLVMLVLAFVGRVERTDKILVVVTFLLAFLMPALATARAAGGDIAGLHPVAAVVLFGLTVTLAQRARPFLSAP